MAAGGALTTAGGVLSGALTGAPGVAEGSGALFSTTAGITAGTDGAAAGALVSTTLLSGGMFGAWGALTPDWPWCLGSLAEPGSAETAGRTVSCAGASGTAGMLAVTSASAERRGNGCGMLPRPGCCWAVAVSTGAAL